MKIPRWWLLVALQILTIPAFAQTVQFKFAGGTIEDGALKTLMESNISALLSEINRAGDSGTTLNFSGINISPEAKKRLSALWEYDAQFVCDKSANISKCLEDFQGFQVRSIPITMKRVSPDYNLSPHRELTISLNKYGLITGVRPAWELHEDVSRLLTSPGGGADAHKRREILKSVEELRNFYNEKNIGALNDLYSDDTLIISEINSKNGGGDKAKYKVLTKAEYLDQLSEIFRNNNLISVDFNHIAVVAHNAKPNIYGVTLHQKWQTDTYMDDGWLFLLWDFNDPEAPQIRVRTWQTEQSVDSDGILTLDDFFID